MKHEIIRETTTGFQPFTIKTTVETQEELDALATLARSGMLGDILRKVFPKLTGCLLPGYFDLTALGAGANVGDRMERLHRVAAQELASLYETRD